MTPALLDIDPGRELDLEPVEELTVTTLVDNHVDQMLPDVGDVRRFPLVGPGSVVVSTQVLEHGEGVDALRAEHGFACLIAVTVKGRTHRLLYDAGLSPDGLIENMRRLEVQPGDIEMVVLSHGHPDHVTGLDGLLRELGRNALPLVVHPDLWLRRRVTIDGHDPLELPLLSRSVLDQAGLAIVDRAVPSLVLDRAVLVTGEVARASPFESGFPGHQTLREGRWSDDPWILDDQAIVVHVRGRGLVVVTGCGHAGVVNIVEHARALTGVPAVDSLIGGFHLSGPAFSSQVEPTIEYLRSLAPRLVVAGHCTGWEVTHRLADDLSGTVLPNTVGTRVTVRAPTAGESSDEMDEVEGSHGDR